MGNHDFRQVARLRQTIVRMRKQKAFDQDGYNEAQKLLAELEEFTSSGNKQRVNVTLDKIARLFLEQIGKNQNTER